MSQTLCSNFSLKAHTRSSGSLPARRIPVYDSLDALLFTLRHALQEARQDLLQPRPQVIAHILKEAATLN